jgi:hypothetical protein
MSVYIKNMAAARTSDGSIALSWSWPQECSCVRVVFLHRLGGRDIASLSKDELAAASDLCFPDEFRIAGGKYIYPVGADDAGLLKFRVYCCDSPESTDTERFGETVQITGITLNIGYKLEEKKSGKLWKKVTFRLNCDRGVPAGTLAYRIGASDAEYRINSAIPAGASEAGPVIVGISDTVTLGLAPGHEDEYAVRAL